jgi:para-nitrobenzyl esterase
MTGLPAPARSVSREVSVPAVGSSPGRRVRLVAAGSIVIAAAVVAGGDGPASPAGTPPFGAVERARGPLVGSGRPVRQRLQAVYGIAPSGLVPTTSGLVQGEAAGAVFAFLGVPYAAPPVGDLRWRPPQSAPSWNGVRAATAFAPPCPQIGAGGAVVGAEDCLYLNLWAPAGPPPPARSPVLFFIHGGGNVQGASSEQLADGSFLYDGAALAAGRQAVVITINYRLGPLGFLALPELAAESPHGSAGNYGILDQEAALEWVRANIASFGGDPARVMVFGESAGALDTCMLLASPPAAGLFSSALMESGACVAMSNAGALSFGAQVAGACGCAGASDVPACLRALGAAAVVAALPQPIDLAGKQGGYQPNVDGWVLPEAPLDAFAAGRHNRVPLVVGANSDETSRAVPLMTQTQYEQAVLQLAGNSQLLAARILAEYPVGEYGGSPRAAYVALTSDAKFICTARAAARALSAGQDEPVFRYFFTHPYSNGTIGLKQLGAYHAAELPYVFGNLGIAGYTPTAGERDLSGAIQGYWSRLAATGDPNGEGAVAWPTYDAAADPFLRLDDPVAAGEGVRTRQCDFWDSLAAAAK